MLLLNRKFASLNDEIQQIPRPKAAVANHETRPNHHKQELSSCRKSQA
jgi:hypothetical protein